MKTYTDKYGNVWKGECPNPFKIDGFSISPMTDEDFIALGGTVEDDGNPTPFEYACAQFRQVCRAMGEFLNEPDFKGGFDEYDNFVTSQAYKDNPTLGNSLAIQWAGTNEYCKYEGGKIGLGQPDWWKKCWEMAEND